MDLKSYFRFNRTDLKGIVSLVLVLLVLLLGPLLLHLLLSGSPVALEYRDIKLNGKPVKDSLLSFTTDKYRDEGPESNALHKFDPNVATASNWVASGLAPYKIRMIVHYLQKGGHFYRPEDLERIYSLNGDDYRKVEPLMVISSNRGDGRGFHSGRRGNSYSYPGTTYRSQSQLAWSGDGVTGDDVAGDGLKAGDSGRAVAKLPGKNDPYSKPERDRGRFLIHLNSAGFAEFSRLPDLSSGNIRDILRYRERNGNFTSIGELQHIGLLDPRTFARLKPYLVL